MLSNIKIIVKHSRIEIHNYIMGTSNIEKYFSIYDRITHSIYYKGIHYDEEKKILYLPRGIDIYLLEKTFKVRAIVDYKNDKYEYNTIPAKIRFLPRDSVQKETLRFMIGEGEYYKNKQISQLSVNLNTGKGKTYCGIATSVYLNIKTIIIASSISWLEQWKKCILEYTDIQSKEICIISGSSTINRLKNTDTSKYRFFLVTHATIRSYANNNSWKDITDLFKYLKIGIKIYDESHLDFDNIARIDFNTNTYKTYYITATPIQSSDRDNAIYKLYFKNIPSISLFDEENDPHTDYISIKFNSKPTPQQISDCKGVYSLDRNKYIKYLIYNKEFEKVLNIVINLINVKREKSLIYIGTTEAIDYVYEWICKNYPELSLITGVFNSKTDKNIKKAQLDKLIILSTTKSCGPAVDIKGLKNTFVLAEPFKSEVLARQTLGRTRDNNTKYYDIVDTGFYSVVSFYKYKEPIFKKYAKSFRETRLDETELNIRNENIKRSRSKLMEYFNNPNKIKIFK